MSVCVCAYMLALPKLRNFHLSGTYLCLPECVTLSLSLFLCLSRYMRLGADMVALRDVDVLDDQVP